MPAALADQPGGEGIELKAYLVMSFSGKNAKARAEVLGDLEVCRAFEFRGGDPNVAHPGEDEGAELVAGQVEGEEIPLIFDASQVVGLHLALFVPGVSQFFVFKAHLQRPQHRPAQVFKEQEVGLRRSKIAEGKRCIQVTPGECNALPQSIADFVESGMERFLKRGSLVLIEHLLGDEKCDDFPFCDLYAWKISNGPGIEEAETQRVIIDWKVEPVAHEIDVPLNSFRGNLQHLGQFAAIGEFALLYLLVELLHPGEGRTGKAA